MFSLVICTTIPSFTLLIQSARFFTNPPDYIYIYMYICSTIPIIWFGWHVVRMGSNDREGKPEGWMTESYFNYLSIKPLYRKWIFVFYSLFLPYSCLYQHDDRNRHNHPNILLRPRLNNSLQQLEPKAPAQTINRYHLDLQYKAKSVCNIALLILPEIHLWRY